MLLPNGEPLQLKLGMHVGEAYTGMLGTSPPHFQCAPVTLGRYLRSIAPRVQYPWGLEFPPSCTASVFAGTATCTAPLKHGCHAIRRHLKVMCASSHAPMVTHEVAYAAFNPAPTPGPS